MGSSFPPAALSWENGEECLEERLRALLEAEIPTVLITVISTGEAGGSMRALLTADGVEMPPDGLALEESNLAIAQSCLENHTSGIFSREPGPDMPHASKTEILCECLAPGQAPLFAVAAEALKQGEKGAWLVDVTDVSSLRRSLLLERPPKDMDAVWQKLVAEGTGRRDAGTSAPLLRRLKHRPGILTLKEQSVYIEPLAAPPVLLLCGGGAVAQAVAPLARACGFIVDVVDAHQDGAAPLLFPQARRCLTLPDFENLISGCGIGQRHYVAILTHERQYSGRILSQVLASHATYIGMTGSPSTFEQVCNALLADGVPAAELAAVCCPIGLSIGAETPEQIAVSIVAELLAQRAGTLQRLRNSRARNVKSRY